jgi:transmembrane sensor
MSDLTKKVEQARNAIDVRWSDDRAFRIESGARAMERRQRRTRAAAAALALVVVTAGVTFAIARRHTEAPNDPLLTTFADGSTAHRKDAATLLTETRAAPDLELVQLDQGAATFEVVHKSTRPFRVQVANVTVEVMGTRFLVERTDAAAVIAVESGRVRVTSVEGTTELVPGDRREFPFAIAAVGSPSVEPEPLAPTAAQKPTRRTAPPRPRSGASGHDEWKALAEDGDYDAAYRVLHETPSSTLRDDAAELFLAADVARLSHHPADAVGPLRTLLSSHSDDARAPLAAFTLGTVLLELGSPREAAAAFAQAQHLDPQGPMAEDAWAREVEGLSRAGDVESARLRAEAYVQRYPNGRRIRAVRRFGNLE